MENPEEGQTSGDKQLKRPFELSDDHIIFEEGPQVQLITTSNGNSSIMMGQTRSFESKSTSFCSSSQHDEQSILSHSGQMASNPEQSSIFSDTCLLNRVSDAVSTTSDDSVVSLRKNSSSCVSDVQISLQSAVLDLRSELPVKQLKQDLQKLLCQKRALYEPDCNSDD